MPSPKLILALLFAICLSCGSILQPWHQAWTGDEKKSGSALETFLGDSRRLFANQIFAKADAYFHSGYYPTIFDTPKKEESHMAGGEEDDDHVKEETNHVEHVEDSAGSFLGPPRDWIDRFSRNFFPSRHTHLEKNGAEREILPWLRLSAELNPQRVETYTIASYWLRSRLGKVKEAEQFLREGLRANPESYEIYFELGRIYEQNHADPLRARNLWEIALRKWEESTKENDEKLRPNEVVYSAIVGNLARLEETQGHLPKAIFYLKLLKEKSPAPEEIQKQIDEIQTKLTASPTK